MALSNIFREPRREITETAAGLLAVLFLVSVVFLSGIVFAEIGGPEKWWVRFMFGCWLAVAVPFFLYVALLLAHEIGESVCARIEKSGIQLRPRRRL